MQTLEQIVDDYSLDLVTLSIDLVTLSNDLEYFEDEGLNVNYKHTLDKLAKLREDTIRQIEEYIENEINVVLGMSN